MNNGTKVATFRDTVNSAIELTCNIAFDGAHTPKGVFLRAVTIFLCYAHDKDYNLEEVHGWGVGEDSLATLTAIRDSARRIMNDS